MEAEGRCRGGEAMLGSALAACLPACLPRVTESKYALWQRYPTLSNARRLNCVHI